MKNNLIISLLLLSVGVSQKILNKKVMIEENLPDSDEIIVYPPNSDEPYSGVVYWFGGVAQLNHQTYKNGIKNGPYKEWYSFKKEKILKLVGNYKNGEKEGLWTYYFEDEKWKEGNYKDGKEDGLWTYYTKGWKWKEETYIDKNISNISHYYRMDRFYRNGQIQAEGNTNFWGSYDGKWTYYNADGTIKEVKEY